MGDAGVQISPAQTLQAGRILADAADTAAVAGSAFLDGSVAISGAPAAGASIGAPAAAFGTAFGKVCADLVESATGLGTLVQSSAEVYVTTENSATDRFGRMVPR
ncbi:MAG: hypothetical protein ABWZ02_03930 [Nakamurella sp.]